MDQLQREQFLIVLDTPLPSEKDFKSIFRHIKSSQFQSNRVSSLTFQFSFILENNLVYHRLFCILFTQIHQQLDLLEASKREDLTPFQLLNRFISYCANEGITNDFPSFDRILRYLQTKISQGQFQKEVILKYFQKTKVLENSFDVEKILWNMYQIKAKVIKNEQSSKNDITNSNCDYDYILCDLINTYALFFPLISGSSEQISTQQNQPKTQLSEQPSQPSQQLQPKQPQQEQSKQQQSLLEQISIESSSSSPLQPQQKNIQPKQKPIRCVDCRKPIDMTLRENGNPATRCTNCFEVYLNESY